ncbi:MAG: hypothetical protein OEZ24_05965 [Candidatus Bathyarchaeota archaeon]|nr:hypothetical protein [Candidatus Bathyarchaeota archaeon]
MHVLEKLRKEVNFGCPVPDCGSPYLTAHHFDPPWNVMKHHNPDGMIALCATHAGLADGGRWTKEQLRDMKRNPFVTRDKISEFYDYLRKNVVCIVGNVAYKVQNVLEINGERVIGFERDADGYDRLNLLIRNVEGLPILEMKNNFWTGNIGSLYDLRCSARGKDLEIVSKDTLTNLKMRFDDQPSDNFRGVLIKAGVSQRSIDWFLSIIGAPDVVPTWSVKGRLQWGNRTLEIRDFEIEDERHNVFGMNLIVQGRAAFSFSNGSTAIGAA